MDGTGIADFEQALALLPADPSSITRGRLLGLMAMACLPDTEKARAAFEEALRIGRRTGAASVTVRGLLGVGAMTPAFGMLAEAASLVERLGDHDLLLTVPMYEAMHHTKAGDQRRSVASAQDGLRRAHRLGLGCSRGADLTRFAARSPLLAGRWDEAAALLKEALDADPPRLPRQMLRRLTGHLALLRGDLTAAAQAAETVARVGPPRPDPAPRRSVGARTGEPGSLCQRPRWRLRPQSPDGLIL